MTNTDFKVELIGYDSGWGCADFRCEDGPMALRTDRLLHALRLHNIDAKWHGPLGLKFLGNHADLKTKQLTLPLVLEGLRRLSTHTQQTLNQGRMPIVIGGDHASAVGTWSGVVRALKAHQKFGLIWLDAHLDSHTLETSHQGKFGGWWHGQPVSALMGHGLIDLVRVGGVATKLSPQHMSMIGIHSFEPGEHAFVKEHNIRVYYLDEVQQRGFKAVYAEALERATTGTVGFGMTVDMDCFDPLDAPGVGAMENKGLRAAEVLPIIKSVARHPLFKALEITEFNPHKDEDHKTRDLLEKIIEITLAPA